MVKIVEERRTKIDWRAAKGLIAEGVPTSKAMVLAGSTAKHPSRVFNNKLSKDETFKQEIVEELEKKTRLIINNIDKSHIRKSSVAGLATSFGILLDKYRLLQGESTSNIAIGGKIDFYKTPKDELVRLAKQMLNES